MFTLVKTSPISKARLGTLHTAHGDVSTPAFQVIATKGAVKTLDAADLQGLGVGIVLSNTYHLYLRPGEELLRQVGGLHKLMGWEGPLLTDSGGYQVFSLDVDLNCPPPPLLRKEGGQSEKLRGVQLSDRGVIFRSHIDGSEHLFTPEKVLEIQEAVGSDLRMVLDQCVGYPCTQEQAEAGVVRTTAWARRSKAWLDGKCGDAPPASAEATVGRAGRLYGVLGIVQGSIYRDLRERSAREIVSLDFDGYAIGGLAVGESQAQMLETLAYTAPLLPEDKVRYLMGVGYPEDIVEAVKLGVDLFDCVIPTREARHGRIYEWCDPDGEGAKVLWGDVAYRRLEITNERYRNDMTPVAALASPSDRRVGAPRGRGVPQRSPTPSPTPRTVIRPSRAYLRHLFSLNEPTAQRLATRQNVRFYLELMERVREGIGGGIL